MRLVRCKVNKHFHFKQGEIYKAWRPNINNVLVYDDKHALLLTISRFYMDFEVVTDKEKEIKIQKE